MEMDRMCAHRSKIGPFFRKMDRVRRFLQKTLFSASCVCFAAELCVRKQEFSTYILCTSWQFASELCVRNRYSYSLASQFSTFQSVCAKSQASCVSDSVHNPFFAKVGQSLLAISNSLCTRKPSLRNPKAAVCRFRLLYAFSSHLAKLQATLRFQKCFLLIDPNLCGNHEPAV